MPKFHRALKCGVSAMSLTLVLASPAYAQATVAPPPPVPNASPTSSQVRPATASDKAPEQSSNAAVAAETAAPGAAAQTNAPTNEIIVTGTSIRGVAPVGSNLISVGRQAIEQTGVQTVQQILKTVPSVVGLASAGQGSFGSADASGTNAPTIHGLGASASNSTLILIDGHRFPLAGVNHALADPNIIPPNAIERVEVLPDGASSVYGSDAVAGVINFITRRHFNGVEVSGQLGFGNNYHTQQAGVVAGQTWSSGWVLAAYNYSHRSSLAYSSRSYLDAFNADEATAAGIDLSSANAQNRANLGSFSCDPATVQIGSTILFVSLPASILLSLACIAFAIPGWLVAGLVVLIVGGTLAQYFHGTLHRADNPAIVEAMRKLGLLMTPEAHALHHATLRRDFATNTGWSNPLVNAIFRIAERRRWLDQAGLEPR